MKKRTFIILSSLLVFIIALIFAGDNLIGSLAAYLSKSEHVDANILLVEGWLPDHAIITACTEFKKHGYERIITTGIYSSSDYFNIHSNGSLIFQAKKWLSGSAAVTEHTIVVNAYSELGGADRAHFRVLVNNSPAGDFYAEKSSKGYRVSWQGDLNDIDSVSIQFDNDAMSESGDRNLYVRDITFDNRITVPWLNNSVYDIITSEGRLRIKNNIDSRAESARARLIVAGIDPSVITAVPAGEVRVNRTLSSALAVKEWLRSGGLVIRGINIVSMGPHSRRTWLTYNKVLENRYQIGIIAVPESDLNYKGIKLIVKTLREAVGLLYYRILLIFY